MKKNFLLSSLLLLQLLGCGKNDQTNEELLQSDEGINKVQFHSSCIIWDRDDRLLVNDPSWRTKKESEINKNATAQMIFNGSLTKMDDELFFRPGLSLRIKEKYNLCEDEKFANAQSVGTCSGVLVTPNIILTAGHCMKYDDYTLEQNCRDFSWSFDNEEGISIKEENLYACKKVLYHHTDREKGIDMALVQLERPVLDRSPIRLEDDMSLVNPSTPIEMIGHPFGMQKTVTTDYGIYRSTVRKNTLYYYLDTLPGNSGSPIFNKKTNKLIAIHTQGAKNIFKKDEKNNCNRLRKCQYQNPEQGCHRSRGLSVQFIKESLSKYLNTCK
ncbi:serine protease [Halobacteriovorax sp. GB3]|uniref:trypsin-like serine peptidase n=1 Tax=Halobacteriovorax sp. GB3 TaxID=2719615 RepID=UPI00235EE101|nr:serine protease [Halobacteriovorax sp. GB3]MDD0852356.1 serine protease [Halobacteriovorax sp. GB3]